VVYTSKQMIQVCFGLYIILLCHRNNHKIATITTTIIIT
jgi:hypothetical protein